MSFKMVTGYSRIEIMSKETVNFTGEINMYLSAAERAGYINLTNLSGTWEYIFVESLVINFLLMTEPNAGDDVA